MIYSKRACMTFIDNEVFLYFEGNVSSDLKRYISSEKFTRKKLMKDPDTGLPKIFIVIDISENRHERLENIVTACENEDVLILCRYWFKFSYETDYRTYLHG